jgi:hypothetical protein
MDAFSMAASSGIAMKQRQPTAAATIAKLTPVLPAVPSVISPPGFNLQMSYTDGKFDCTRTATSIPLYEQYEGRAGTWCCSQLCVKLVR